MKKLGLMFGLLVLGVLFSSGFDDIYIRSVNSQPLGEAPIVYNCDRGGDGPSSLTLKVWVPNPFGEPTPAVFYYRNGTTGEWVRVSECSVLEFGKECQVFLPVYLGGKEEGLDSMELLKATMAKGSTSYEATMDIPLTHAKTDKEKTVENKTAVYVAAFYAAGENSFCDEGGSLCCKLQSDYSSLAGLDAQAAALVKECRVDDARMLLENAINSLNAIDTAAPLCNARLAEIATAEATASGRGCNTGNVRTQIDALKEGVRNGEYDTSLSALNSALSTQCLGATVEDIPPSDGGTGTGGTGTGTGTWTGSAGQETGNGKPVCPGMFILLLLPLALVVYPKWGF